MRKFSVIFSSIFLLLTLTTFNKNNTNIGFHIFKIDIIEIKNLKILDKKIKYLFYNELLGSNLLILDKKRINKISKNNELINYIEFKEVYPSKLKIVIFEKEPIAIINNKQNKFYLIKNGEEIKFFNNSILKNLPNILENKKFLDIYNDLIKTNFQFLKLSHFIILK